MLTNHLKLIILSLLFIVEVDRAFAKDEDHLQVETASKIDVRLLQESKKSSKFDDISWFSRYSSLLVDFQKMEKELLAYKSFFANWDIPVSKDDERISRNLFEEIENIGKKLQDGLSKLDEIRLGILSNEDLKEQDKEKLFQSISQLRDSLKEIYFFPSRKNIARGKVLDINLNLKSIIINLGIENGVFEGSRWITRNKKNDVITELTVILVKRNLALAQLIKGDIENITINTLVERKIKK